ncbi:MAG: hypothetical protein COV74_07515 [Candidatus Omnitrophica bacterium CG11_big_fil_rev_8_21_14_0_20_45_26]|uniref:CHAD domain-containing protein n=1 Tax=Candidatus Abzuiibacterium crystallinum TaxID=1974748 RepID=A0A2H0LMZ4_9BACT|nr:MAG: hypothetical protein COV74_07515 [Candidatus Omnitrophica bacterium CG11_big_fil_rev_8_21_14_0_20_45_26]PIW64133.1 MAG: hypothetical protein COW12_07395 [Candidatus Omnitrophica bacterium CG12_big_fil_rev_8_21_14_0_65_45_16]
MTSQNKGLHTSLKKRVNHFTRPFKPTKQGFTDTQINHIRLEAYRIREWLTLFEGCFSRVAQAETHKVLARLLPQLEEFRNANAACELLTDLVKAEKNLRHESKAKVILKEFESIRDIIGRKAGKQLKQIKPRKLSQLLQNDFKPNGLAMPASLIKYLNQKRETLFNQLVLIIRTAKQEDLAELLLQMQVFCYLLELSVDSGFQKGRRLLQTLRVLQERLAKVCDEEFLRQCLQDMEKERARVTDKISDIQQLRLIRIRLGIQQARTLKLFHDQLPPVLQGLKRHLSWS